MCSLVLIALNEIASVSYLELIKALAPVATAVICVRRIEELEAAVDGGRDAAHLDVQMGLAKPAILAGRLHGGGGLAVSQKACTDTRGAGAI